MRSNRAFDYARILRFAVVGVLNTTLGYSIIVMGLALGYGDIIPNISGYAGGLILGFVLNRRWTFSDATHLRRGAVLRYALSFLVAYSANLAMVLAALSFGYVSNPWVHLAGICIYSVLFYLASSWFVFVPERVHSSAENNAF